MGEEYQVKSGDSWYRIAKTAGISLDELLKANNANTNTVIHPG
jgi:LysM repeat protein